MGKIMLNSIEYSGGGNADIVHLTQAQYDALPSSKNYDGKVYMITDVNGDGSQFQPVIYSEDEREIGVWTDGKPLYQKTIKLSSVVTISANSWGNISILSEQLDINYAEGVYNTGSETVYYLIGANCDTNKLLTVLNYRNQPISLNEITLRYTKTTDQAGSGTWTPQGVPAVHYSTDEQVIGTWIDGSTLYQKTINSNLTLTNSWQDYFDLTGVNKIIDVNKIIVERDGEQISYVFSNNVLTSWIIRDGYIKFAAQGNLLSETWILKSITIQYTKSSQGGN